MNKRLQKRQLRPLEYIPAGELMQEINARFLTRSEAVAQKHFDELNNGIFDGALKPTLIIYSDHFKDGIGGLAYAGGLIVLQEASWFAHGRLYLLHEMNHILNHNRRVEENDHGEGWAESLVPIHARLNIDIDPHDLTEDELRQWPVLMLERRRAFWYVKRSIEQTGRIKPFPKSFDWTIKVPEEGNDKHGVIETIYKTATHYIKRICNGYQS